MVRLACDTRVVLVLFCLFVSQLTGRGLREDALSSVLEHLQEEVVDGRVSDELEEEQMLQAL